MINKKTSDGLGTQLRRLVELMDGDLERIYRADGHGYRPRYTPVMKALADGNALNIKDIAAESSLSHSAASQTISQMLKIDLLEQQKGEDGRERLIRLSAKGKNLLPLLRHRWAATQIAANELDAELPMPLSELLAIAILHLQDRTFGERIKKAEKQLENHDSKRENQ